MLSAEDYAFMKSWFDQGVRISEIARQTGYNRRTIKKYISSPMLPAPKKRARRASKLDGYRDYITGRLQEHPLSAKRIYDEILERGFTGKYSIVKEFVRETKQKIRAPQRPARNGSARLDEHGSEAGRMGPALSNDFGS